MRSTLPNYDFFCNKCNTAFELFCKIAELDDKHKCPNCKSIKTEALPSKCGFGDAIRLGITKVPSGFKEVLQKIHRRTPGSTLNSTSRM